MLLTGQRRFVQPLALLILVTFGVSCHPGRRAKPICMPGDHRDFKGRCTTQTPLHKLPFRAGYQTAVTQGFHGLHSHKDEQSYAVDFLCNDGDPVVATHDGIVWEVREDSLTGCGDISCDDEANYVVIDTGRGTYSEYHHLAPYGALVAPGDQVCAGQVIGICGATGYTGGPHLHWQLSDLSNKSIPARFHEIEREDGVGYPIPGTQHISQNERTSRCRPTRYSKLARDAFAHHGILLEDPLPLVWQKGSSKHTIRGRYFGAFPQVAVYRRDSEASEQRWRGECVKPAADGHFEISIDWEDQADTPGYYWFMLTGADKKCENSEWAWSYRTRLDGNKPPEIVGPAEPPPSRDAPRMPE